MHAKKLEFSSWSQFKFMTKFWSPCSTPMNTNMLMKANRLIKQKINIEKSHENKNFQGIFKNQSCHGVQAKQIRMVCFNKCAMFQK